MAETRCCISRGCLKHCERCHIPSGCKDIAAASAEGSRSWVCLIFLGMSDQESWRQGATNQFLVGFVVVAHMFSKLGGGEWCAGSSFLFCCCKKLDCWGNWKGSAAISIFFGSV